jgi:hypothetical protein
MKMNECTSRTWTKMAEIPTDDLSVDGIARAINKEFGEPFVEDILEAIAEGYIQVCEDGIIIWAS